MAGVKRDRQREAREARRAAEAAAAKKALARKRAITFAVSIVVLLGIVALASRGKADKTPIAAGGSTSTTQVPGTAAGGGSAAGKPCVAVSDPLPAGAPTVPVKVGPPPAQLVKEDLKTGTGAPVTASSTVTVNYIGVSCSTGKIFDSSYSRNQPASFPLSGVIKGWQDGIPGMNVGGQRLLGIPPEQAYGASGQPPTIAPAETLWFVVEVVDAK